MSLCGLNLASPFQWATSPQHHIEVPVLAGGLFGLVWVALGWSSLVWFGFVWFCFGFGLQS